LPSLPLEIVRVRVARAKRLGLPYRTYATIRATSGRDIVAFLFSGQRAGAVAGARHARGGRGPCGSTTLGGAAERLAAVYAPLRPEAVMRGAPCLDAAVAAPTILTRGARRARACAGSCASGGCRPMASCWSRPRRWSATGAGPRGWPET
jgi:hypothetical protein